MSTEMFDPDSGRWVPAEPLGWQGSGPDFEVSGTGPYHWEAFDEDMLIGSGRARTRIGLAYALRLFKRQWRRTEAAS